MPALLMPGGYRLKPEPFAPVRTKKIGQVRRHDTLLQLRMPWYLFLRFRHVCHINQLAMSAVIRELIARYCVAMEGDERSNPPDER